MKILRTYLIRSLFVFCLLTSCNISRDNATEVLIPSPTSLPMINTPISSTTPSPSNNTASKTPQTLPQTPLPTLSPTEARLYISDMLKNNTNCHLPCWWGFVPGHTTWQEAQYQLKTYAIGISTMNLQDGFMLAEVKLPVPYEVIYANYLEHTYWIKDGYIEAIEIYNYDFASAYSFIEFLNTYGMPSEVYIRTYGNEVMGSQPFIMALFYPKQGILVIYPADIGKNIDDDVQGCFRNSKFPFIYVWGAGEDTTFEASIKKFRWYDETWAFRPLEEATQLNVEEFYQGFRDPNNAGCLDTPAILWPEQ